MGPLSSNRRSLRLALLLPLALAFVPARAAAEAKESFTYQADVVWSTIVRLLRVDLGYDIAEQDRDNGYLMFVIHQDDRDYHGSVQFVPGAGERGQVSINLSLSIAGLPEAVEQNILRKLRTKLREDYGLPPRPPAVAAPPPASDDDHGEAADQDGGTPADGSTSSSSTTTGGS